MRAWRLLAAAGGGAALIGGAAQAAGRDVFEAACSVCHGPANAEQAGFAPPLANSSALKKLGPAAKPYLVAVLLKGMAGKIVVDGASFVGVMPSQAQLSDRDLSQVADYVFSLNGMKGAPSAAEFASARGRIASLPNPHDLRQVSGP